MSNTSKDLESKLTKKEKIKDFISCYARNHIGLGTDEEIMVIGENRPDIRLKYEDATYFIDGLIAMTSGTAYAVANLSISTDKGFEVAAGLGVGFVVGWAGSMIEVNGTHYIKKIIHNVKDRYKRK